MSDHLDIDEPTRRRVRALLRGSGARFAFVHGSVARGGQRSSSDLDVAAWFGGTADEDELRSRLPDRVDLLMLDDAPLELAGRVAQHGVLLFDDDPTARVAWQATTRKIFLDERPRVETARRDFAASRRERSRTTV